MMDTGVEALGEAHSSTEGQVLGPLKLGARGWSGKDTASWVAFCANPSYGWNGDCPPPVGMRDRSRVRH